MMVRETFAEPVFLALSVTITGMLRLPAVVGVPLRVPDALNERPSVEVALHVYPLPLPPEAVRDAE